MAGRPVSDVTCNFAKRWRSLQDRWPSTVVPLRHARTVSGILPFTRNCERWGTTVWRVREKVGLAGLLLPLIDCFPLPCPLLLAKRNVPGTRGGKVMGVTFQKFWES